MTEETIFANALAIADSRQRLAFLDEACAGQPELRRQIEELLRAHEHAGNFLRRPAIEAVTNDFVPAESSAGPDDRLGTRIGPYKLLQRIGEGGMGVVFMAEQVEPVRRMVALKVIKPGMDSSQVLARFEAERQALALMDHPQIARVLDAGTTAEGRPYFVMELVKGVPITKFCDDNNLPVRRRLELFVGICQAIQHAHQKGIIHRDLKPSNVLVAMYDDQAVPKVIDFGVAKAMSQRLTERTMFTEFGALIGTLEYMSPEQAKLNALDIDTRSDVYSLGVLLYELLTGTTPLMRERLKQTALDEALRMIREDDPPPPSTRLNASGTALPALSKSRSAEPARLATMMRGELDWIVMRALDKNRTRRYETASALARDLDRYLKDEPVEACPPSILYQIRKMLHKNRKVFTAAAVIALLLVAGTVVSTWQALRATHAENLARVAMQDAVKQRDQTKAAYQKLEETHIQLETSRDQTRRALYGARMNLMAAAWDTNNLSEVHDLLETTRPKPGEPDLRGFEWRYYERQSSPDRRVLTLPPNTKVTKFSADGSRIAALTIDPASESFAGSIQVWDTGNGGSLGGPWFLKIPHKYDPNNESPELRFSGDDRRLTIMVPRLTDPSDDLLKNQVNVQIRVWEIETGQVLSSFEQETFADRSHRAQISPDGSLVLIHKGKKSSVYNTATGKQVLERSLPPAAVDAFGVFSGDGRRLALASFAWKMDKRQSSEFVVLDTANGDVLYRDTSEKLQFTHPLAVSHSGDRVLVERGPDLHPGSGIYEVVDVTARKPGPPLEFNVGWRHVLSDDGSVVISLDSADELSCWRSDTGEGIWHHATNYGPPLFHFGQGSYPSLLTLSANAKRLAVVHVGSPVLLLDAGTGRPLCHLKSHRGGTSDLAFARDRREIITVGNDLTVNAWSEANLETKYPFLADTPMLDAHHTVVAETGDGTLSLLAIGEKSTTQLRLLERATGKIRWTVPTGGKLGPFTGAAALGTNGQIWLETGSASGETEHFLDTANGQILATIKPKEAYGMVEKQGWTSDGKQFYRLVRFSTSVTPEAHWIEWGFQTLSTKTGAEIANMVLKNSRARWPVAALVEGAPRAQAVSANGKRVAVLLPGPDEISAVKVWDTGTGAIVGSMPVRSSYISSISYYPLLDINSQGTCLACVEANDEILAISFWDVDKSKLITRINNRIGHIWDTTFSPDSRRFALVRDGMVQLFDVQDGQQLANWKIPDQFDRLWFSPDGNRLVGSTWPIGEGFFPLMIWDASPHAGQSTVDDRKRGTE